MKKSIKQQFAQVFSTHHFYYYLLFLLAFIPLYPKIPLFSPIEQYIVRVRFEDIFVLLAGCWWLWLIFKKQLSWKSPISLGIIGYIGVGLLSTISAILITQTVPIEVLHIAKTALHWLRYIEYFSLFFMFYGVVKQVKQIQQIMVWLALIVIATSVYGFGQKYFYWPVYSTMNREFSKGLRLYLTPHARVQSTFAGHYDLAAFLVILLPILVSAKQALSGWRKNTVNLAFLLGLWLLVVSASRMPFAASLVGVSLAIFISGWLKQSWAERFKFWLKEFLITYLAVFLILYYFGSELIDRLSFVLSNPSIGIELDIRQEIDNFAKLAHLPTGEDLAASLDFSKPPTENALSTEAALQELVNRAGEPSEQTIASGSDQPPIAVDPRALTASGSALQPKDVFVNVPEPIETEVTLSDGSVVKQIVQRQRVYSQCALEKELSLCIRLESLWPWALQGFYANPVLGTGYATLNKADVNDFTIAESTDNNYLRTLGETGALGFLTFYGVVAVAIYHLTKSWSSKNEVLRALFVGMVAACIGLLLNASYIDVFVASKVAFTFWALMGIALAASKIAKTNNEKS